MRSQMPDVIVLLPGITGSVLTKNNKVVWGYSGKLAGTVLLTRGGTLREELSLQEDSPDAEVLPDGIVASALMADLHLLPGVWKIDGYSAIRTLLLERFKLEEGVNFFQFPYDWRRDNRAAARMLARQSHDWLEKWRASGHSDARLILVAHSMGGLVARYFLEVLGGWVDTRALFTFGTPFRGSLNALDALANGMKKGPLGLIDLSELARTFTSMYQLLPIYPAYARGNGPLVRIGETSGIPNLDPQKASAALAFHKEIADAVKQNRGDARWEERGYQTYPIVGVEQETYQSGRLNGTAVEMMVTYQGKVLWGDGTVPQPSALPVEFDEMQPKPGRMYAATQHGSLQNASAVLTQLASQIDDLYLDFGPFRSAEAPGPNLALETEDLVFSDEPIRLRARANQPIELTATLLDPGTDEPVQHLTLEKEADGWQVGAFSPAPAGYYRLRVDGPGVTLPAEDAVAVADAASRQ